MSASGKPFLGDLERVTPISRLFGLDRGGTPVDRFYIEAFLGEHAADVAGRVLEVADDDYTRRFGGAAVRRADVLSIVPTERATMIADLCAPPGDLPWEQFDCIVLTQTLQFVGRPEAALTTLQKLLRPGGVLLLTVPGISQISRYDADRWGDRWRFTSLSLDELLRGAFGSEPDVRSFGNVLAAVAMLHGLVVEDIGAGGLEPRDPDYEVVVAARAVKP